MSSHTTQSTGLYVGAESQQHAASAGRNNPMVQSGVEVLLPSDKKINLVLQILPALDYSKAGQPGFKSSMLPYRNTDPSSEKDEHGHRKFSPWFVNLRAYSFIGRSKMSWISPITRPMRDGMSEIDVRDPMLDMYTVAKDQHSPWNYLTVRQQAAPGQRSEQEPVRRPDNTFVVNVHYHMHGQASWKVALLMLKQSGFIHLREQLNAPMLAPQSVNQAIIDPAWMDYLLGDITDPNRGMTARVIKQRTSPTAVAETWCACYSSIVGRHTPDMLPAQPFNYPAILEQRYDLTSITDTFKIESYQTLVDKLVADGMFPLELIRTACGGYANVPSGAPGVGHQQVVPQVQDTVPMSWGSQPQAAAQPPAFGAPAAPAFGAPAFQPQAAAQPPAFGAPAAPAFGAPAFQPQAAAQPPAFGAPAFQPQAAAQPPAFGAPAAPAFGAPAFQPQAAAQPPAFGAPAFQPQAAAQPPAFGAPAAPAFGAPAFQPQAAAQPPAFGAPAFQPQAAAQPPAFGAPAAPAFGAPAFQPQAAAQPPAFGAPAAPAFGASEVNLAPSAFQAPPKVEPMYWVSSGGVVDPKPHRLCDILASEGAWPSETRFMAADVGKPQVWESLEVLKGPGAAPVAAPSRSPLSEAEKQEYMALSAKMSAPGYKVAPDEAARLGELASRAV